MTDFDPMSVPEASAWNQSIEPPPGLEGFIVAEVSLAKALAVAGLIWPKFIRVDDCVILSTRYSDENFQRWSNELEHDGSAVERMLNHVHLWDFFDAESDTEEHGLEFLAEVVAAGWKMKAEAEFTDRDFMAEITDEYGPTIVLHSRPKV